MEEMFLRLINIVYELVHSNDIKIYVIHKTMKTIEF